MEIRELVSSEISIYFERYLTILHSFCIHDTFSEAAMYILQYELFYTYIRFLKTSISQKRKRNSKILLE